MYIIDAILLTKIPHTQPQILSYFFSQALLPGALILTPLGKRKEIGVVIDSHKISAYKLEIKKADFELKNISKIITAEPILTTQQLELTLWLGQYYFTSPGLFLKMMLPKKMTLRVIPSPAKRDEGSFANARDKSQKLILVPTVSMAEKIAKGHSSAVVWHSGLTKKQQNEIWWKVRNGEIKIIVGTRSAIFLPFKNLKEIVIEDETNPNHRSWDMFPHYRVHETAQKLTEIFGAKIVFKSDTPSIESVFLHKDKMAKLSKNFCHPEPPVGGEGSRGLPQTHIIDMRSELRQGNFSIFSRELQEAIKKTLEQKKQIILFINRRGAANFVLCRDCGYVVKCKNCEAPMAYHLINQKPALLCHRCGYRETPPGLCPKCQSHRIKTVGAGTQKVEIEAAKLFPKAKILRLDSDSAPTPKEQQEIVKSFVKKETDILIATQIILSWSDEIAGTQAALVAIISADTLLHLPDFQSGERVFQAITALKNLQASANSQLIIQTYNPESPVIKYADSDDWQSFYDEEIETRKVLGYPPFSQIVKLTFHHKDPKKAGSEAKILAIKLKNVIARSVESGRRGKPVESNNSTRLLHSARNDDVEISDALPAFIPKEKGKYVWNIIIKFKLNSFVIPSETRNPSTCLRKKMSNEFLQRRNSLLQYVPADWGVDVDPIDLL